MTGKVTVRMVAEAAQVSLATVSRVLNNDPHVHATTRTRVIRCAQQLGYRLEPGNGRRIIALVLPDGGDLRGYGGPLLANLRAEISMRKYRTELIGNTDIEMTGSFPARSPSPSSELCLPPGPISAPCRW